MYIVNESNGRPDSLRKLATDSITSAVATPTTDGPKTNNDSVLSLKFGDLHEQFKSESNSQRSSRRASVSNDDKVQSSLSKLSLTDTDHDLTTSSPTIDTNTSPIAPTRRSIPAKPNVNTNDDSDQPSSEALSKEVDTSQEKVDMLDEDDDSDFNDAEEHEDL